MKTALLAPGYHMIVRQIHCAPTHPPKSCKEARLGEHAAGEEVLDSRHRRRCSWQRAGPKAACRHRRHRRKAAQQPRQAGGWLAARLKVKLVKGVDTDATQMARSQQEWRRQTAVHVAHLLCCCRSPELPAAAAAAVASAHTRRYCRQRPFVLPAAGAKVGGLGFGQGSLQLPDRVGLAAAAAAEGDLIAHCL